MRVVHAAALTAAAILLASITSAQGLGGVAAREREKRNATPAKPAKVYTDREVASTPTNPSLEGESTTPATEGGGTATAGAQTQPAAGASSAPGSADEQTPEQKAAAAEEKAAAAEAEAKAKAETEWRSRLEAERKVETRNAELIAKLEADLGDISSISFGPNRTRKMDLLEEAQKKLADTQANIATIEEEGRRNGYR
jgi:hypothetical protein